MRTDDLLPNGCPNTIPVKDREGKIIGVAQVREEDGQYFALIEANKPLGIARGVEVKN